MAKNKTLLIVAGVGIAAAAVYMLTKRPATTTTLPPAPGAPVNTGVPGTGSGITSLLNTGLGLFSKLFGGSAPMATTPPLAQTTIGPSSPAAGIPYINPTTPGIPISVPPDTSTAGDTGSLFNWLT